MRILEDPDRQQTGPVQDSKSKLTMTDSHSNIVGRVASGTLWKLLATLGSRAFTIGAMIAAARLLGKADFGALGMVQSTVGMFGVLAGLGLGVTATKYVAELRGKNPIRLGRILSLVVVVQTVAVVATGGVIVAMSRFVASKTINAPHLVEEIRLAALLLAFLSLNGLVSGALAGFEAWRSVAIVSVVQGATTVPAVLLLASSHGVAGAVVALTLAATAGLFIGTAALIRQCAFGGIVPRWHGIWTERRIIWKFAVPATLTSLTIGPVLWAANAVLVNTPGGYGELGGFRAVAQWKNMMMYVPGAMAAAFLPVLSQVHGTGDKERFTRALGTQVNLLWLSTVPIAVGIICCGRYVLLLYGASFAGHELLLAAVVFGAVIHSLTGCFSNALVSTGRMWLRLAMYAVGGAVLVGAAFAVVPRLGAVGLALAHIIAYAVHVTWQLVALRSARIVRTVLLLLVGSCAATVVALALVRFNPLLAASAAVPLSAASFAFAWLASPSYARAALVGTIANRWRRLRRFRAVPSAPAALRTKESSVDP